MFRTFMKSNFYISILLISSFLILTVLPNLINSYFYSKPLAWILYQYTVPLIYLSDTVDNIIYVLLYKPVRNVVKEKLLSLRNICEK